MQPAPMSVRFDAGPPCEWVRRYGLPTGGAWFDGGAPGACRPPRVARRLLAEPDRYSMLCLDPVETLVWDPQDPRPSGASAGASERLDPFEALAALGARASAGDWSQIPGPRPLVACALSYDLGRRIERLPSLARDEGAWPELWAARYRAAYVWDHGLQLGHIVAQHPSGASDLARRLERPEGTATQLWAGDPRSLTPKAAYLKAVRRIRRHIEAGDVYQVNYTMRFEAPVEYRQVKPQSWDPSALFLGLRARSASPLGAFLRVDGQRSILSISPERFLRWDAAGHVETRPIKGTRPRGATPELDRMLASELMASPKDRAEHIMIVDLERNDLGRVCVPGSVYVEHLATLGSYSTVHHLVSTVGGQLGASVDLPALLRATFPGGSITGAPKVRAMEIIEQLEPTRRGVYCGAVGYLDAAGGGDLNLPIRTAWTTPTAVYYQAGGGIVADSDPEAEWQEAWIKAQAFVDTCRSLNRRPKSAAPAV